MLGTWRDDHRKDNGSRIMTMFRLYIFKNLQIWIQISSPIETG